MDCRTAYSKPNKIVDTYSLEAVYLCRPAMALQVHYGVDTFSAVPNPVITIGTFDGVHVGHQQIIRRITELAQSNKGESVLITFEPHPRLVLNAPPHDLQLLTTIDEKARALEALGVHHLVVAPFTPEFAQWSADQYVQQFIVAQFKPHTLVIGYDHQFGKQRSGNFSLFQRYQQQGLFNLEEIPAKMLEMVAVSSTRIRKALLAGEVTDAADLLGRSYSLQGLVIPGQQRGRHLGYPTANLSIPYPYKLIPAQGVYAVRVHVAHQSFKGMMNIGTNPTFTEAKQVHLEVHLLDYSGDLYGQMLEVEFLQRIRAELRFERVEDLVAQIKQDELQTRQVFNEE